jgi:hypothetical protein
MATRTAQCACGRVEVTVEGEPRTVLVCHCDFCQRRSGNVFIESAQFLEEQVVAISGETTCYNGLEVDGIAAPAVADGINYRFCSTCASTLYWDYVWPFTGQRMISIAVGNFVDSEFPIPTVELSTSFRHHWVSPIPGAAQDRIS